MVVELVLQGLESAFHITEVAEPPHVLVHFPSKTNLDTERVAVQASALVPLRHIRQHVRCLKRKLLIDLQKPSSWYPEILMSLKTKTPNRVRETVVDRSSCARVALRAIHRLQVEMLKVQVLKGCWVKTVLRKNEFQLVATPKH